MLIFPLNDFYVIFDFFSLFLFDFHRSPREKKVTEKESQTIFYHEQQKNIQVNVESNKRIC